MPPRIDEIHAEFFSAIVNPERAMMFPGPHEAGPEFRLVKNVYNMAPVFPAGGRLIVTATVRNAIGAVAEVRFRPATIEWAYSYPYAPDDTSYEEDDAFIDLPEADPIIRRFAEKYRCPIPDTPLYEMIAFRQRDLSVPYNDIRKHKIGAPVEGASMDTVVVSRQMVQDYGLVSNMGYQCTPEVFKVLDPFLRRPFFWVGRFDY